ncbi:MAG TPA: EAL domain-containing protein [Rugosimonospora sp.]|nr:EAL domain-containing protein [Rugosimonospora sp.]
MSVEPATPPPATGPVARTAPALVPFASTALLTAGVAGLLPVLQAVCAAIVLSAAVHTTLLVRTALAVHRRYRSFSACRGAGYLGLAVLTGGLTALVPGVVRHSGAVMARVATGGIVLAAALYVTGMLLFPSATPNPVARIRQALDGLGIGMSLLFTGWILVVAPEGRAGALAAVDATVASVGVATAVVTLLRSRRSWAAALACTGGTALGVLGLSGFGLALAGALSPAWLPLIGGCLVYGPLLAWLAARRYANVPIPGPELSDATFAGYPVMAAPIAAVLVAALYHMFSGGDFDMISACLGCGVVAVITVREMFAVFDIRRFARTVATQEAHFRSLVAGSSDVTMVLDSSLAVRWQSPAAARQFGLSDQDTLDRPFTALIHPEDVAAVRERLREILGAVKAEPGPLLVQARLRDGFGHWRDTEACVNDLRRVPEVAGLVVHLRDVGERRALERTLHRLSFSDPLTGLANRQELLRGVSGMRGVPGQPGTLIVIALEGLAGVYELRGRDIGEAVLVEAARRVREASGESDLPARLTGEELAVATAGTPVHAYAMATRLLTLLGQAYQPPGFVVHLAATVGMAELASAASANDALGRAELALSRARQEGRGRIEWYDEVLEAAVTRRAALEQDMPGAVQRGELDLVYQPVLDLVEQCPVGVEALVRWHHPRLGTVSGADLVPVAEDLGLISEIGEWVVNRACRQLSGWLREGHELWLAINLAGAQLAAPTLVEMVRTALDSHEIATERLIVEITEAGLSANPQLALAQLAGLRQLGVRTALAQFGTGATPLAHLRRLPVDVLKVDRVVFGEQAGRGGPPTPIMDVVVGLGRRLGLEIVAEGLEADAQLEVVRAAGCRYGQGYLFAAPAPAEHFEAFLEGSRTHT